MLQTVINPSNLPRGSLSLVSLPFSQTQDFHEEWGGIFSDQLGTARLFCFQEETQVLSANNQKGSWPQPTRKLVFLTQDSAVRRIMIVFPKKWKPPYIRPPLTSDDEPELWKGNY